MARAPVGSVAALLPRIIFLPRVVSVARGISLGRGVSLARGVVTRGGRLRGGIGRERVQTATPDPGIGLPVDCAVEEVGGIEQPHHGERHNPEERKQDQQRITDNDGSKCQRGKERERRREDKEEGHGERAEVVQNAVPYPTEHADLIVHVPEQSPRRDGQNRREIHAEEQVGDDRPGARADEEPHGGGKQGDESEAESVAPKPATEVVAEKLGSSPFDSIWYV